MKTLILLNQKFVEMIESKTFPQILVFFVKIICAILLALALVFPNMLVEIFNRSNYLLIKVVFSFLVFFQLENLIKLYDFLKNRIEIKLEPNEKKKTDKKIDTKFFEGVPINELADYISENQSCKILDMEKEFNIPRYKVMKLMKSLEKLGIFERGENNQRELKAIYTKSDLKELMTKGIIKIDANTYSTTPTRDLEINPSELM